MRSVLLYGSETWSLTARLGQVLAVCDRKMLRRIVGVRWEDGVQNSEVAERCGLKEIEQVLRERRLRWYGHVARAEEGRVLREIQEMEVAGRRPRGRPRKRWMDVVQEDLCQIGATEDAPADRRSWRRTIRGPTPHS